MYNWYRIFNKTEFLATGLVSRTYTLNLEGIGQKSILVTQGNCLGMTYEGTFLMIFEEMGNPFKWEGHAMYVDANNDVFLGFIIED